MKKRNIRTGKDLFLTMADCLMLGIFICFGQNIPLGKEILFFIGAYKFIIGILILGTFVAIGMASLRRYEK